MAAAAEAGGVTVSHLMPNSGFSDDVSSIHRLRSDGNDTDSDGDDEDLFLPTLSEGTPPQSRGRRHSASRTATAHQKRGKGSKSSQSPRKSKAAAQMGKSKGKQSHMGEEVRSATIDSPQMSPVACTGGRSPTTPLSAQSSAQGQDSRGARHQQEPEEKRKEDVGKEQNPVEAERQEEKQHETETVAPMNEDNAANGESEAQQVTGEEESELEVECPEDVQSGDMIVIRTEDGSELEIEVPDGVASGETFVVTVRQVEEPEEQQGSPEETDVETPKTHKVKKGKIRPPSKSRLSSS